MQILLAGVILLVSGMVYGSKFGVGDGDSGSDSRNDSGGPIFLGMILIFFGIGAVMKGEHPFQMSLRGVLVLSSMLLWLDVLIRTRDDTRSTERPMSLKSALKIAYGGGVFPPPTGAGATYGVWGAQVVLWGLFFLL